MVRQDQPDLVALKERIQQLAHELADVLLAVAVAAQIGEGRIHDAEIEGTVFGQQGVERQGEPFALRSLIVQTEIRF